MFQVLKSLINENNKSFLFGACAGFFPTLNIFLNTPLGVASDGILIKTLEVFLSLVGSFATGIVTVLATKFANRFFKKKEKDEHEPDADDQEH